MTVIFQVCVEERLSIETTYWQPHIVVSIRIPFRSFSRKLNKKILNFQIIFNLDFSIILFLIWSKDKSQRYIETEEFQIESRDFYIHPKYKLNSQAQNFDICLIKITEFGMNGDLSTKLNDLPCMKDDIDLKKVFCFEFL